MSSENGSDVDSGLVGTAQERLPGQTSEAAPQAPAPEQTAQAGAQSGEGRRTQLRIVRENIHSLSKDVGSFRKSHEVSIKSLEKQLTSLRKELAERAPAKDSGGLGGHPSERAVRSEEQHSKGRSKEQSKARGHTIEDPCEGQQVFKAGQTGKTIASVRGLGLGRGWLLDILFWFGL